MMPRIALALVCLVCGGHGRRLCAESPSRRVKVFDASPSLELIVGPREPSRRGRVTGKANSLTTLTEFFFALHPALAFNPAGPWMRSGANAPTLASPYSFNTAPPQSVIQGAAAVVCEERRTGYLLSRVGPSARYHQLSHQNRNCRRSCQVPFRFAPAVMSDVTEELTEDALELKEELLEILQEVTDRGIDAPRDLAADILDVVVDMDEEDIIQNWRESPHLEGRWRLIYTSSTTFAKNRGMTLIGSEIGISTPELIMKIQPNFNRILYEEAVVKEKLDKSIQENGFLKAVYSSVSKADIDATSITVDCGFRLCKDNSMTINPITLTQGDVTSRLSNAVTDQKSRASRAMGNVRPVFLDQDLIVFRSYLDYIVWIFERAA